jgi:hypothetical protein
MIFVFKFLGMIFDAHLKTSVVLYIIQLILAFINKLELDSSIFQPGQSSSAYIRTFDIPNMNIWNYCI